ncbi:hypothetical protein [Wolbachia endosymbiont of Tetranychus urticae]|uniref:hypothetical protein n=1 Tax=Wolbachia endosymbiont of Tetranychus urticae TaxID=169184 RepID=UPI00397C3D06
MPIYIRFENQRQVETTTLENKPEGKNWHQAPKDFSWQKSYCLKAGKIVEENIEKELLDNAKRDALTNLHIYFSNHTSRYAGYSHQKAKSYEIQAKAAENILAAEPSKLNEQDTQIIEPLAKVRGITVIEMAKIIQEKAEKAVKAIAKCEEIEDSAKKSIKEAKIQTELQTFLNNFEQQIKTNL